MSQPDLIIFDCDGVLIDSEILATEIFVEALSKLGVTISAEEACRDYLGMNRMMSSDKIEARYGVLLSDEFWDGMFARAREILPTRLRSIPGIESLLDRLTIKKCVASSSGPRTLEFTLGLTHLWDRFAPHIYSATQVKNGKPAPDLFLYAAEKMGVPPSGCLVIEDSLAGVRGARAANMKVFGFVGGSHCWPGQADMLRAEGAEHVFSSMVDIQSVLCK